MYRIVKDIGAGVTRGSDEIDVGYCSVQNWCEEGEKGPLTGACASTTVL